MLKDVHVKPEHIEVMGNILKDSLNGRTHWSYHETRGFNGGMNHWTPSAPKRKQKQKIRKDQQPQSRTQGSSNPKENSDKPNFNVASPYDQHKSSSNDIKDAPRTFTAESPQPWNRYYPGPPGGPPNNPFSPWNHPALCTTPWAQLMGNGRSGWPF